MQLVQLRSNEFAVVEVALSACHHFIILWQQIHARPPGDESPVFVNLPSASLHQVMEWGWRHRHEPMDPDTTDETIAGYLTPKERVFLLGRPVPEFRDWLTQSHTVGCARLMAEVMMLNNEWTSAMQRTGRGVWRQQELAVQRMAVIEREERELRKRLQGPRGHQHS